jgi:hypothetical protein
MISIILTCEWLVFLSFIGFMFLIEYFRPRIIEEFDCQFNCARDGVAYLTFISKLTKEEFYGECPVYRMFNHGISERQRFTCRTIQIGKRVTIQYEPIPFRALTQEEWDKICREVDEVLAGGYFDGDDY